MLFKGCPSIPNRKAIKEWSKIYTLNTFNATTNYDNTCYMLKCLPEKYNIVLSGLRDIIFKSFINGEDAENEKKVIIQEVWDSFLNDKYLRYKKEFISIAFIGNQLSRLNSAIGWPETIEKISREDIIAWYNKNYGIGNFYIVLTGAVGDEQITKLEGFLKDLPEANLNNEDFGVINKPSLNKIIKIADEIGQTKEQVEISIHRVSKETSYENNEIASMLARLMNDLLNEKLRSELDLCYVVNTEIWRSKKYTRTYINIKTEEKNIELVEKEFQNIIDSINNKKQIDKFNIIKNLYKEQIMSREFLSGDIADIVLREVSRFDGHIITQKEQIENINRVNYGEVVKFASEVFDPEYLVTEIILPSKK